MLSLVHVSGFPFHDFVVREYHGKSLVVLTDRQQVAHQSALEERIEPTQRAC